MLAFVVMTMPLVLAVTLARLALAPSEPVRVAATWARRRDARSSSAHR